MTKKEKRAWDHGFEAHDGGSRRNETPPFDTVSEVHAWQWGWDTAHNTEGRDCPAVVKEDR